MVSNKLKAKIHCCPLVTSIQESIVWKDVAIESAQHPKQLRTFHKPISVGVGSWNVLHFVCEVCQYGLHTSWKGELFNILNGSISKRHRKKTILNKSASGSKTDPKSSALNQNTLGPIGFFFGRSAMWSNKENAVVQAAALLQALIAALQAVLLLCWRHGVGWTGTFCSVQNRLSPKYVEMRAMCGWTWTSMFWVESETRVQESGIKNAVFTDYLCEMWNLSKSSWVEAPSEAVVTHTPNMRSFRRHWLQPQLGCFCLSALKLLTLYCPVVMDDISIWKVPHETIESILFHFMQKVSM